MASWFENLSLRSRIVLLTGGVMLAFTALVASVLAAEARRIHDAAQEKVRILAIGSAADVQRVLDQFESVLDRLSRQPLVKAMDPEHCDPLGEASLRQIPASLGYAIRDARGNTVCAFGSGPVPRAPVAEAAGVFAASNVFVDERSGRKFAALSYPIRDGNAAQTGLLVMTVDLLTLSEQLFGSTPKSALVTVVDRTRAILLRSTAAAEFIGSRPRDGEADPLGGAREGHFAGVGRDGVPRLFALLTLPGVDWRVIASLPQADVLSEYDSALRRTVAVGLGLCLLALGLAWRLSAAIANPIARREATAAQITAGRDRVRADVTDGKQAEEALRAGASTLQAALSSMSDAVFISDTEGRFIEFNDAFASFHRFADKSACPRTVAQYPEILELRMPDGDPAPLAQWAVSRALRGEVATNVEYRLRRKDTGETWTGSYGFAPICSKDGTIVGAVVTSRDVTAIREVQEDLESSHVAMQRLIASRDQVQEEERKRIARELHDDLQQTLAAIRMDLRGIGERFGAQAPELLPHVAEVDGLAEKAVVSTRRIVNDLRPPMLDDLGLMPALEMLVAQFSQQAGVACKIDAPEEASDALMEMPAIALCLYRVVQEALNNVAKHSHASEVHIQLALATAGSISVRVSDNGRGIDAADRRKSEAFGILGIQERVRALGGSMGIDSRPGGGTVLDIGIPLAGAPAAFAPMTDLVRSPDGPDEDPAHARLDDTHALPRLLSRATHKTLQDVIDALAGVVAVVDRRGVIRFVNRAWIEFAERNGNPGVGSIGPGVNYLEVCRRSAAADDSALRILQGLDEVMRGDRQVFTCEYPCHSPDELRWFQMHATPMATGDVMVAHFLVSRESHVHVVFGMEASRN
ncbi:PAS domain-containing protein [Variovorax sp. M-6]|uniref:PAS domain-containing protein n=1 Tax=Variovorax sp. M-6 TaxID=3233041 RepID=UPI003F9DBDAE